MIDATSLDAPDRALVEMLVHGRTLREIASSNEMTEGRAKHRLFKSIRVLRDSGQDVSELEKALR